MRDQAISLADLRKIAELPRIYDLTLGERLGFGQPVSVRKLIRRHKKELGRHGEVISTLAKTSVKGGRPAEEYHLNEAQALVICMHAQTPAAVEVRAELIDVFMAYRRGELERSAIVGRKPKAKAMPDKWAAMEKRMSQVEKMLRGQGNIDSDLFTRAVAYAPNILFLTHDDGRKRRQTRPRWWFDLPVREMSISLHRQMTVDAATAVLRDQMGLLRAPSRSSLGRFWRQLDELRASL